MKICVTHWQQLRAALVSRGLEQFIKIIESPSLNELVERLPKGTELAENYDPLLSTAALIFHKAKTELGHVASIPNDDRSPRCPICVMERVHEWGCTDPACKFEHEVICIQGGAEVAVEHARQLGLIARPVPEQPATESPADAVQSG